ncbi:MAG: AMP-binding enzyme, partial [Acidimicrobiales bacterium]
YRVVEAATGVIDSLVVDTSELGSEGKLFLFVVPGPGAGDDLAGELAKMIRSEISPRHVPDDIVLVERLPHTLNGKRIEVPARRILLGVAPQDAVTPGAVDDRAALERFVALLVEMRPREGGPLSP